MSVTQKELEILADRARFGSRPALASLREELDPTLVFLVDEVRRTGGEQNLPLHAEIRSLLAAARRQRGGQDGFDDRRLVALVAGYLWDRTEARWFGGAALETVAG
jgi:hypothetical protein